jgi:signal transduction histidine kinase
VTVDACDEGSQVTFHVADQGRGIPPDKIAAVFEQFQQVDSSDARDKGGTGLRLPITKSIVERHGGRMWVESVLGAGSTFRFTLPAAGAQPPIPRDGADPLGGAGARAESRLSGRSAG